MPKAERRISGARAAPYPSIKPGDKPRSTSSSSTTKPASTASTTKSTGTKAKNTAADKSATKKALADKPSTAVNIGPKTKATSKTKKAVTAPTPVEQPTEEDIAPTDTSTPSDTKATPKPKASAKKATPSKPSPKSENNKDVTTTSSFLDQPLPGPSPLPIHDTCSTIRSKINDLLGKSNTKPTNGNPSERKKDGTLKPFTKASFARAINCSPRSVDTFLGAKKMMGGAESAVYPAAYEFFEKKRLWEGKEKTKSRLKVEADRPNGLPLRDPNHMRILVRAGENPADFLDEYGQ